MEAHGPTRFFSDSGALDAYAADCGVFDAGAADSIAVDVCAAESSPPDAAISAGHALRFDVPDAPSPQSHALCEIKTVAG